MDKWDMNELAGRSDALAWAVLLMAAHLEESGNLNGAAYCQALRQRGDVQGSAGMAESENSLAWMAQMLDTARQTRLQRSEIQGGRR